VDLLRFITCGSVDDGKSTLIGRLLHDSDLIHDDQLDALKVDSERHGTQGEAVDLALLVDGLQAEREQGITIDVAYRYFATAKRKFIVADTPGHEQYTRNMATGASTADLAVILVDARKGVLGQTRRHAFLAHRLGVRQLVLAVNKMDLVGNDRARFEEIVAEFAAFAQQIGSGNVLAIPISALTGDNVTVRSKACRWYDGPSLLEHLEGVEVAADGLAAAPFRMPVQWVSRPGPDFRGFCGTVASGTVRAGDRVRVLPAGRETRIASVLSGDGEVESASAAQSITLTFADDVDCSRGDMVAAADDAPEIADQFEATLVWMDEEPMLPGRSYLMKIGTATVGATVTDLKHQIDLESLSELAAKTLELNAIGAVNLALDRAIPFAPYEENRELGGLILIDRISNASVGAGMIHFALRRSHNIHWQHIEVGREARAAQKQQQPKVVWFTGLSGSGKSTIANLVEKKLLYLGRHSFLLDGDNVRHGLNKDLGFTDADRVENVRRVGEVARLMSDAGLIVLCAFISPFRAERRMVREMMEPGEFIEVFVDTTLAEAERRDVKGLYRKARAGELANFTGIDSPYEEPEQAEIRIDTARMSAEDAANMIVEALLEQAPSRA
jgi:bifunctional enzyme CysN/CysC